MSKYSMFLLIFLLKYWAVAFAERFKHGTVSEGDFDSYPSFCNGSEDIMIPSLCQQLNDDTGKCEDDFNVSLKNYKVKWNYPKTIAVCYRSGKASHCLTKYNRGDNKVLVWVYEGDSCRPEYATDELLSQSTMSTSSCPTCVIL